MKIYIVNFFYRITTKCIRKLQQLLGIATIGVRAVVVDDKNRVLLVRHTYSPGWYLPGGGVKKAETTQAAIIRELQEETGIVVRVEPELLGVYYHKLMNVDDYPVLYVVRSYDFSPVKCSEIAEIGWFNYLDLPLEVTEATKRRLLEFFMDVKQSHIW